VGLVGRRSELLLITARLADRRVVTLIGPGGIGKTALARAAVDAGADRFAEGARWVDLTRVDSADGVRESLAAQLGFSSFRALLDAPADQATLLAVDNCEHVVDAVAEAIAELLDACEMPTVLATSRSPLELPGEVVVPVGPLEPPPAGTAGGPAVDLFCQRAADAGVTVEPTDAVAELCRRLDGVPLAIELAAARCRSLTPEEILARLQDGLDVLDRPRRRVAPRHQGLRSAIAWSHDLLSDEERHLFDRLAVVPGPFTAHLAHSVAAPPGAATPQTVDLLDSLVATSMLVAEPAGAVTWYRQLETIRAFAREQLDAGGHGPATEARLADHVTGRAAAIIERGAASWSADALAELIALYPSIAATIRWCLAEDHRPDRAQLLVAVSWGVIHQAHTTEVADLAEAVLARWPGPGHPLWPDAVATAATCRYMLGDHDGAIALALRALDAAEGSPVAPATLRRAIAQAHRASGDAEAGLEWFAATGEAARRLGLVGQAVEADTALAQVLADVGRIDEALVVLGSARGVAVEAGSELAAAWARTVEGSVLLRVDPDRAAAVLDDALVECHRLRYPAGTSAALRCLAFAELLRADVPGAAGRVLELLDDLLERGSTLELRLVLDAASAVLSVAGRAAPATSLAATALALPVVSITASVGHELFPLDPGDAEPLAVRDAILLTRAELPDLAPGGTATSGTAGRFATAQRGRRAPEPADGEPGGAPPRTGVFRRVGDHWEVGLGDTVATLRAVKGLADLATLLGTPSREVHCLELIGAGLDESGTGDVLDAAARRSYEDRVRQLQGDLDDAEADHDLARAEVARAELDAVVDQLVAGLGLGGRARTSGSAAERARSAVTQRIRASIRRIDQVDPALGAHLRASVTTGAFCRYAPELPVTWQLDPAPPRQPA
jgi:predicted ATPase